MKKQIINIPNILTTIRLLLSFIFVYFIIKSKITTALVVILIAILTDILDGYFARKLKQETKFGKIFDVSTDGFFFLLALIILTYYNYIEKIITIIIIFSGLIRLIGWYLKGVIDSSFYSKASGLFINLMIITAIIHQPTYEIIKWPTVIYNLIIGLLRLYQGIRFKLHRKL